MERMEQIHYLIEFLLEEQPQYRAAARQFGADERSQRRLLRSLMNLRAPMPLRADFLEVQDALLQAETRERGTVKAESLPGTALDTRISLWQGDITRLGADAIVNAANSALLGCFSPCHGCIDNAIHSAAGLQLRDECSRLMAEQGHPEPSGTARLTGGYNLPCRYVLHTVGPIVQGELTGEDCAQLAGCYRACLGLAERSGLRSAAFCCISTGEFHFPNANAAAIAVQEVVEFYRRTGSEMRVIFNVFKDLDYRLYRELLGEDRTA